MPTKNHEKIINAAVYIDGKPIKGIQETELPEISIKGKINMTAKGNIKVARTKTDTSTYEA